MPTDEINKLPGSIDIVIPTLNSASGLEALLGSIRRCASEVHCIWVVDGGSSDHTLAIAAAYGARIVRLDGPSNGNAGTATGARGYSMAKNVGSSLVDKRYVLFLDSDMELDSDVTGEVAASLSGGAGAVTIPERSVGNSALAHARAWERNPPSPPMGPARAPRAFDVSVFVQAKGYRTDMPGFEDLELAHRLGLSGCSFDTSLLSVIHHEDMTSLSSYIRKRIRYASGGDRARELMGPSFEELTSIRRRAIWFMRNLRAKGDLKGFLLSLALRSVEAILVVRVGAIARYK